MLWDQTPFGPIMLLGRKPLVTLRDAAQYIAKLPGRASMCGRLYFLMYFYGDLLSAVA
jgi:hypothetical protein